jgi:hypothetical protein
MGSEQKELRLYYQDISTVLKLDDEKGRWNSSSRLFEPILITHICQQNQIRHVGIKVWIHIEKNKLRQEYRGKVKTDLGANLNTMLQPKKMKYRKSFKGKRRDFSRAHEWTLVIWIEGFGMRMVYCSSD